MKVTIRQRVLRFVRENPDVSARQVYESMSHLNRMSVLSTVSRLHAHGKLTRRPNTIRNLDDPQFLYSIAN